MREDDVVLALLAAAPAVLGTIGWRIGARLQARGGEPPLGGKIALATAATALCASLVLLGLEVRYRFAYDRTDAFSLTRTSQRWFARHYRNNAWLLRDDVEYTLRKPPGTRRITFVGDSFTVGHGVADVGDRFANRIRAEEPGWDVQVAAAVRERYPDILLMLDANSAYTLADADHLKQLDPYHLLMLEQPLGYTDIYQHSQLQPQMTTPICLDESIHSADDARLAFQLGACKIINLKPSRVGGYTESLEIYKVCVAHDAPLWIGGMMETGIGRAANVAFASLPGVTLPCDISATSRYYARDLTEPPFELQTDSTLLVPTGPGLGVEVHESRVQEAADLWEREYPYKR